MDFKNFLYGTGIIVIITAVEETVAPCLITGKILTA
jgi:hypothetical protein